MEKISVPSLNIYSHEMSSPKLDNKTRAQQVTTTKAIKSNNPFINSPTSPVLGGGHHQHLQNNINNKKNGNGASSTNPFLRNLSEVDAENNNTTTNGRNNGSTAEDVDSEEDNLDVQTEKIVDKNPFRETTKTSNVAEDKNGGNKMTTDKEEIVTVNEIDGGRVAEIIRVSVCSGAFILNVPLVRCSVFGSGDLVALWWD